MPGSTRKRCANGSRKNKQGVCVKYKATNKRARARMAVAKRFGNYKSPTPEASPSSFNWSKYTDSAPWSTRSTLSTVVRKSPKLPRCERGKRRDKKSRLCVSNLLRALPRM